MGNLIISIGLNNLLENKSKSPLEKLGFNLKSFVLKILTTFLGVESTTMRSINSTQINWKTAINKPITSTPWLATYINI